MPEITSKLKVQLKDLRDCGEYDSLSECLLATAGKRQFKTQDVSEGVNDITINGIDYNHRWFDDDEFDALKIKYAGSTKRPSTVILTLDLKSKFILWDNNLS